jgi:hypothetical protein
MATTLEIVRGLSQAAANGYDGALDENGEPIKMGLKREEGHFIKDSRVVDGFGVKFHGDKLIITYQSETNLKEVKDEKYENEIEGMINNVANFLKKEYRKVTGGSVSLTKEGECDVLVQRLSNYRTFVQASLGYKIGGLNEVEEADPAASEDRLEDSIKKFLELGKGPKPKNVTRKDEQ